MKDIKKLVVKYNDNIVGYLVQLDKYKIAFQYDEIWIKHGFSISPFSLPLDNELHFETKGIFDGLFGVFQDSMPDGWGELLLRRKLAKNGVDYDRLSPLQKLSLISSDGLGGLTYEPSEAFDNHKFEYDLDDLAKESKNLFDNNDIKDLDQLFYLGGSSGGSRPKAHIRKDGIEYIVKFPCHLDPTNAGQKEALANKLAKECGINTNDFILFESKICSGYFGAKRFDRDKTGKRIHMISLSSILETSHRIPNLDYVHLFQVVNKICINKDDLYEAYRRMCFNVLYGNKDDHGKNFAFLYNELKGGYELSPMYDITKTIDKLEHEMTVLSKGNPSEDDLLEIAKMFNLSLIKCKEIIKKQTMYLTINEMHF